MRRQFGIIGAGSLGLVAAAAAIRAAGLDERDVLVIDDWHADPSPPEYVRPARAPRRREHRQQFGGVLGMVLNNQPALATFTSEKPLTKRQRRRARGKGNA